MIQEKDRKIVKEWIYDVCHSIIEDDTLICKWTYAYPHLGRDDISTIGLEFTFKKGDDIWDDLRSRGHHWSALTSKTPLSDYNIFRSISNRPDMEIRSFGIDVRNWNYIACNMVVFVSNDIVKSQKREKKLSKLLCHNIKE